MNPCRRVSCFPKKVHMIYSLLYGKLTPHVRPSISLAQLGKRMYGQTVLHPQRELELSGSVNDAKLPKPTRTAAPSH